MATTQKGGLELVPTKNAPRRSVSNSFKRSVHHRRYVLFRADEAAEYCHGCLDVGSESRGGVPSRRQRT